MQLHGAKDEIAQAGGNLVAIGNGKPEHVAKFREKTGYAGKIYCDPSRKTYRAVGLTSGLWRTLGPRALGKAGAAKKRGSRQTKVRGHAFQQGGALIISPPDKVLLHHVNEHSGDNVPPDVILAALRSQ